MPPVEVAPVVQGGRRSTFCCHSCSCAEASCASARWRARRPASAGKIWDVLKEINDRHFGATPPSRGKDVATEVLVTRAEATDGAIIRPTPAPAPRPSTTVPASASTSKSPAATLPRKASR
jgi:hypothetical protein